MQKAPLRKVDEDLLHPGLQRCFCRRGSNLGVALHLEVHDLTCRLVGNAHRNARRGGNRLRDVRPVFDETTVLGLCVKHQAVRLAWTQLAIILARELSESRPRLGRLVGGCNDDEGGGRSDDYDAQHGDALEFDPLLHPTNSVLDDTQAAAASK